VGIGFPLLRSATSLSLPSEPDRTLSCRKWLQYWVVLACFLTVMRPLKPILAWVPFSGIAETLFYLWLQLPFFGGSEILFQRIVEIRAIIESRLSTLEERRKSLSASRLGSPPTRRDSTEIASDSSPRAKENYELEVHDSNAKSSNGLHHRSSNDLGRFRPNYEPSEITIDDLSTEFRFSGHGKKE
jgi:hypothetical protein